MVKLEIIIELQENLAQSYLEERHNQILLEEIRAMRSDSQFCFTAQGASALWITGRNGKPNKNMPFKFIYDSLKGDPKILQWFLYAKEWEPDVSPFKGLTRDKGDKVEITATLKHIECIFGGNYRYQRVLPHFIDFDPRTAPPENMELFRAMRHCYPACRKGFATYAETFIERSEEGEWAIERRVYEKRYATKQRLQARRSPSRNPLRIEATY
jgi:hypothetical protein